MAGEPGFWDDRKSAQQALSEQARARAVVVPFGEMLSSAEDMGVLIELGREESDEGLGEEIRAGLAELGKRLDRFEVQSLLSGEHDRANAILSIHAGAGGTESCDWAEMLLRMYGRWAERKGFKLEIVDIFAGEEAGVRNVTVLVSGDFAYGYLKTELGVHRLVRISPFDSAHRRHTSFSSVDVIPEIADTIDVEINTSEIRVDTYRAGGCGGQHVNTTDSAVRITHLPTGIVAQCQEERSQHKNKAMAMRLLRSKMFEHFESERQKEITKKWQEKSDIGWGSQVRSYVLAPYTMVKDHRSDVEVGNASGVLDGDIDVFMEAILRGGGKKGQ